MDKKQLKKLLQFLHEAEGLKKLLRHSWLSNGRRESVAEHSWRLSLMVMVLASGLEKKVNMERALKIVIIHDLAEVFAGDHWAFKKPLKNKHQLEKMGLKKITRNLPKELAQEFMLLWEEYEIGESEEAKLAKAVDKIEVLMQHNEAKLQTWNKVERKINFTYGESYCQYDPIIRAFRGLINLETVKKLENISR